LRVELKNPRQIKISWRIICLGKDFQIILNLGCGGVSTIALVETVLLVKLFTEETSGELLIAIGTIAVLISPKYLI